MELLQIISPPSMYRKENLWTIHTKKPTDSLFSKSGVSRGVSSVAGRMAFSKSKVDTASSSTISNSKRIPQKDDLSKEDTPQRGSILNDKQNGSQYGYNFVPLNDRLKEKEEWAREQKRQQMDRMKLNERVDQSKRDFMESQRLKQLEIEAKVMKEEPQEGRNKEPSVVKMPSIRQISLNPTAKRQMLVGLNNIGNTCYMNSTLQCLLHIPEFNDYFLSNAFKAELKPNGRIADAYGKLVATMYNSGNRSETPSQLKQALGFKFHQFAGYSQEDAQELLVSLRESINEDISRVDKKKAKYRELTADPSKHSLVQISQEWWKYYKERDDSIIEDFFSGQLLSKVMCTRCKGESIAFDNFQDLTLSFGKYETSAELLKMIEMYLGEETLSDDFFCSKCKELRQSTRKLVVFRLPKVLVIQLKRFSYGKWRKEKINTKIQFPDELDLKSFVTESKHESVVNSRYKLVGVVNHSGGIDYGHYTADCQDIHSGRWFNFNDSSVSEISSYSMGQRYSSSSPYLLFYHKK